ncbi:hypothetical protein [Piscirickettsia litoralis]|uniref:Type IV secretion protein IcmV n=1 Tax=Piscirickettsia litoralis TaxID=1891921 RepID=A0ABX3A747_9GAMM|nr:hypothetical protein [Piscirickettsia litoralis]ODN43448.1 hypothetical protein BGC07_11620 [Piscirickettsia litoralis]
MIKKFTSFLRKSFSYPFLKESYSFIFVIYKKLFSLSPEAEDKTKVAIDSAGVSEDEVKIAKKAFLLLAIFYFISFIAMLAYTVSLIFDKSYMTAVMGSAVSLVCFTLFFKYHFWLTQTKSGYLGMTFKEWLNQLWK